MHLVELDKKYVERKMTAIEMLDWQGALPTYESYLFPDDVDNQFTLVTKWSHTLKPDPISFKYIVKMEITTYKLLPVGQAPLKLDDWNSTGKF